MLAAYNELYELSLVRPHRTIAFKRLWHGGAWGGGGDDGGAASDRWFRFGIRDAAAGQPGRAGDISGTPANTTHAAYRQAAGVGCRVGCASLGA